jgi:hypothetical protein
MAWARFAKWRQLLTSTVASSASDFHRKFWTWLYIKAGKRVSTLDVAEYWDHHWQRIVAHRLHQTEERYGQELVRYLLTPTDSLDSQGRDFRDATRDIRVDR